MSTPVIFDFDRSMVGGVNSSVDPAALPSGTFWMGVNTVNVGGLPACRPGFDCIVKFPDGKMQGGALFRPKLGLEQLVVCIDGNLYAAEWPFRSFRALPGVRLSETAKQVFFCLPEQSAKRVTTDLESAIELITPRNVLIVQDGGQSAPVWFDGSQAGQDRDFQYGIPAGGPMAWIGDRLWVAKGNYVFASDVANPFSFREQVYLGGTSAFVFPSEVTALASSPSTEAPLLLVFTESDCSALSASIRERDAWPSTANFQQTIFSVGCLSQRSVVSQFGQLIWFSAAGVTFFDAAIAAKQESRLPLRDTEMAVSKAQLSDDLSLIAGAAFGQFMLMSVPAADRYNAHTWVMNNAPIETVSGGTNPVWCGYWTGVRPVQWIYGSIAGKERIYCLSVDADGGNRLWEAFQSDMLDNGCPILWATFSRGYFGDGAGPNQNKLPGGPCRFKTADIAICRMSEDLDLAVFVAPVARGAFRRIFTKQFKASRGMLQTDIPITFDTQLFAYKPQSRRFRTADARNCETEPLAEGCPVEAGELQDVDDAFQLLIVGSGPAALRWTRPQAQPEIEDAYADGDAFDSETKANGVRFDGVSVAAETEVEISEALTAIPFPLYESARTVSLTAYGVTEVGVGHAVSPISQAAADRLAERIAERQAAVLISQKAPPVFSQTGTL